MDHNVDYQNREHSPAKATRLWCLRRQEESFTAKWHMTFEGARRHSYNLNMKMFPGITPFGLKELSDEWWNLDADIKSLSQKDQDRFNSDAYNALRKFTIMLPHIKKGDVIYRIMARTFNKKDLAKFGYENARNFPICRYMFFTSKGKAINYAKDIGSRYGLEHYKFNEYQDFSTIEEDVYRRPGVDNKGHYRLEIYIITIPVLD